MITLSAKGDYSTTYKFLNKISTRFVNNRLELYGQKGINALAANTPKDTGLTAASWYYEIEYTDNGVGIYWKNSNVNNGVNIAIILQYGHGTNGGGYVQGIDYINPALRPIFEAIADDVWKEVTE